MKNKKIKSICYNVAKRKSVKASRGACGQVARVVFPNAFSCGYNNNGIYIERGVQVMAGACVWSGNIVLGESVLCAGCELLPHNHIDGAEIGAGCKVGPFARLRKGTQLGNGCKIGNFVELKNAKIGENVKISHLTYVGDARIGKDCNIGCGVVFCNYDGEKKHECVIGDSVFIGSNANLVAPLKIGSNTIIGAGTTVTRDVACGSFVIGRVKQDVRKNKKLVLKE